jgi:SAM-dependent methyltransferase
MSPVDGYDATSYGERISGIYDSWYDESLDPTLAVELLADLAGSGRALELGIGTGRVAVPLAGRGIDVSGIDASDSMVERLRAKPGGDRIPVAMGDFADVNVDGSFTLIYVPFATFYALLTQEEQVRCLRNVAARLEPGGRFVMDGFVPDAARAVSPLPVSTETFNLNEVVLDAMRHDPLNQIIEGHHIVISRQGTELYPLRIRYCYPSELDLMAQLAGLFLEDRYADYDRSPFTGSSESHVSVYQKPQVTHVR